MDPKKPYDLDVSGFVDLPRGLTSSVAGVSVHAEFFDGQIDPKAVIAQLPRFPVLHQEPLILQVPPDAYLIAFKFGGVVLWGCGEGIRQTILSELKKLPGIGKLDERVSDRLTVSLDAPQDSVSFKKIYLKKVSVQHLIIISAAFSKSVGLEHFEIAVAESLRRTEPLIARLKAAGGLMGSERSILQTVGFTLDVRQTILANLALFDDPPETWTSETMSGLHHSLSNHFEVKERVSAIENKLSFLNDLNVMMADLLATRHGHRLEWIVIALILFEIVLSLFQHFSGN